jgi:hypothetical protein
MSRHLMARFRHLASRHGLEWQHGVAFPHTTEWFGDAAKDALTDPARNPDHYNPANNSVAFADHGEQRYGLEVMPHQPWKDSPPGWAWTIQKQNGPDASNPDHWGYYFHLQKEHGPSSANPSGANYSGGWDSSTREEAMADAEHNFQKHLDHLNGQRPIGDYDINDIMRDQGF